MTVSTIEDRAALVIIDLQRNIVGLAGDAAHDVVANSAALAAEFRATGRPVVLVTVAGRPAGRTDTPSRTIEFSAEDLEVDPALGARGDDVRIVKRAWGAFIGTDLDQELHERGVNQVVLTGISTSIGVESTARSAYELGYHVVLVSDAMADTQAASHEYALGTVFPRLGEVATTAQVLEALAG